MSDKREKSVATSFDYEALDGEASVYRPGWKPGTVEADDTVKGGDLLVETDEWKPVTLSGVYSSKEWPSGMELELRSAHERMTDTPEHATWVSVKVNLDWNDMERLRDALSFLLATYRT